MFVLMLHAVELHSVPDGDRSDMLREEVEFDDSGLLLLHGISKSIASVVARLYKYNHMIMDWDYRPSLDRTDSHSFAILSMRKNHSCMNFGLLKIFIFTSSGVAFKALRKFTRSARASDKDARLSHCSGVRWAWSLIPRMA